LRQLTDTMAYRGPNAQSVWADGAVGLGHTLLRTTDDAQNDGQPCRLDGGDVWIVADARLDGRRELVARLQARGIPALDASRTPDVTLILHAYHAWGEECVRYLLGDFAFVVWDGPARRLFRARDPLGLKLFYYARVGASVLVGKRRGATRTDGRS